MKKIINGKRYNTESAEFCGSREYGYPGDLNYVSEELYQKRTGEFFLHGEGGANSKYREEISMNSWSGGEKIIPLTDEEAREWAEEYLDSEDYEKLFTVTEEEDAGKKIQSFSLRRRECETHQALAGARNVALPDHRGAGPGCCGIKTG